MAVRTWRSWSISSSYWSYFIVFSPKRNALNNFSSAHDSIRQSIRIYFAPMGNRRQLNRSLLDLCNVRDTAPSIACSTCCWPDCRNRRTSNCLQGGSWRCCLALALIEALFHVTNGCAWMNLVTACDAIHWQTEVIHALAVLIKFRLVKFASSSNGGASVEYSIKSDKVYLLVRYPKSISSMFNGGTFPYHAMYTSYRRVWINVHCFMGSMRIELADSKN